jgi:hypothetical protein
VNIADTIDSAKRAFEIVGRGCLVRRLDNRKAPDRPEGIVAVNTADTIDDAKRVFGRAGRRMRNDAAVLLRGGNIFRGDEMEDAVLVRQRFMPVERTLI